MKIDNIPTAALSKMTLRIHYSPQSAFGTDVVASTPDIRPDSTKPRIRIAGPTLLASDVATALGEVLGKHGFYNYVGEAAVVGVDKRSLEVLTPERFRNVVEKFITPIVVLAGDSEDQPRSLTQGEAKEILSSESFVEQLPSVDHFNVVRLPLSTSDGIRVLAEGYDPEHRVLTAGPSVQYPFDKPAVDAKTFIDKLLGGFPFAGGRDRAGTVAMMLTAYVAELIPPKTVVPAFLCNGDGPGLGKNILVQLAMVPVLGSAPASVKAKDEEEVRKLLLAIAREGRRALFFDNVAKLSGASLESFITTPTVAGRILGKTETVTCPKSTVVYATGNNCTLTEDMRRRTIVIQLTGQGGDVKPEPVDYLDEPRINELSPEILASLFALVRDWGLAKRPKPSRSEANFPRWAEIVGGIVEHAGYGLPY